MLLTIVIPTYKRQPELLRLLHWLEAEVEAVAEMIRVVISDNASPGGVSAEVISVIEAHPWMSLFRQPCNVGPDRNFMDAVDLVVTPYFWLLGDDDLMVKGLLSPLLAHLQNHEPDLIYLPSHWTTGDLAQSAYKLANFKQRFISVDAAVLATHCHVNLTFISSWVVKRVHWRSPGGTLNAPSTLIQTNLLQMSWILQALCRGRRFSMVDRACVIARSGNTGGYKLLTVFGKNLREILVVSLEGRRELLEPILNRLGWTYLPSLIWFSREQQSENFLPEDYESALALWSSGWAYKTVHKPMLSLPKWLAFLFFVSVKILDRVWTMTNWFRYLAARIKS
ncbi:glycosyltransferase family 2 protein [Variovorax sp. PCZ-1]|uniref:glycosyltransferase family 2 protein n=1 Tax=Variovorax sp. PCZ-1 TaxID=2835533 RepID=UPI001BCC8D74|nr:glycosyltransferase family 2 protein [Variovorax sp. PCZ-1]MBS7808574.1 glycosyltransferase family 2 protein [Variovorax sp. PCZ-1]